MPLNHASIFSELTDNHFKLIGEIVVEWSNIEFLLGSLLSKLLVTPEYLARSYTDHMSAVKLQEAIKEGVEIHRNRYGCQLIGENELDEIISLNNRITNLRVMRNKFTHFCWCRSNDDEIFGTKFSGGITNSKKEISDNITYKVTDLEDFHTEAYKIVDRLSEIVWALPEIEEDGLLKKITRRQKTSCII
jgi:hypothetical protein